MINILIQLVAVTAVITPSNADRDSTHLNLAKAEVVFQWDWLKFYGLNHDGSNTTYNPQYTTIYDVEIFKNNFIVTTPRFRRGVPFTLVTVDDSNFGKHGMHDKSPKLKPFPDGKGQTPGNCHDLQNVITIELDTQGRLWVLDAGVLYNYEEEPDWKCPPKLVIYDIKTHEHPEVERYEFPEEVLRERKSVLTDLTLQRTGTGHRDWVAFISDAGGYGIVVFNMEKKSSYRVEDESMKPEEEAGMIEINKKKYDYSKYGVDGIVVDKNLDKIYFTPLASYNMYSIPGTVLRNKHLATDTNKLSHAIKLEGHKESHNDGLYCDSEGRLFFGLLEENAATVWSPAYKLSPKSIVQMTKVKPSQWLSSFTIKGCWLYIVSDRVHQIKSGEGIHKGEINNEILRLYIGTKSYKDWLGQLVCPPPITPQQLAQHKRSGQKDKDENTRVSEEESNSEEES